MLFNSFDFFVFLIAVLTLLWFSPFRVQKWILAVASCVFYGYWDWRFLLLLFFTGGVDYLVAQKIEDSSSTKHRKWLLSCSLISNLTVLGFFKYSNFFIDSMVSLLQRLGFEGHWSGLHIILPVGISFYTFQSIAYTVDVYRGHLKASRNPADFLMFITFFPQLVAGPIERAQDLMPQLVTPRKVTRQDFVEGFYLVLWGLTKKVVVADTLALKVDRIFAQSSYTTGDVILGTLGFAFQIYADFSGYTDMARGVARWLGIRLTLNFNHPYFSSNPQEFWRRWHISLSTWLREYLYIPLGGNRLGSGRTYMNLMTTMLLGGLWHGAAWNYVLWGAYQGALLAVHRFYCENIKKRFFPHGGGAQSRLVWGVSVVVTFMFVLYGWLLFRVRGIDQLAATSTALFQGNLGGGFFGRLAKFLPYIGIIAAVDSITFFKGEYYFVRRNPALTTAFYLVLVYLIIILGVRGGEQFIYFAF